MKRRKKIFLWSFFISVIIILVLGAIFFSYTKQISTKKEKEKIFEQLNLFSEMGRVFYLKKRENLYFTILNCFLKDNKSISNILLMENNKIIFFSPKRDKIEKLRSILNSCNLYNGNKSYYCFKRRINKKIDLIFISSKEQIERGIYSIKILSLFSVLGVLLIVFLIHFFVFKYVSIIVDKKIKESEDKFQKLVENTPAGVLIIEDGKIVYVNPKAVEMLGAKSEKEVLGKPPVEFVADEFKAKSIERQKAFESGVKVLPPVRGKIRRLDGKTFWVETRSLLINYRGKNAIQSIMWDISKIKKAEDELREAKTHLENLYNSSNMIIFSLDKNYKYLSFNELHRETMKKIWGVDIEKGMNMLELIKDPEDRKRAKNNFDKALSGNYFVKIEEYGEESLRTFYENIYSPLKNEKGEIVGLIVFVQDVTERIDIESKVRRLSRVVETSPQGIVIFGLDFKIVYANKKAMEIVKWDYDKDVLGKRIFNFVRKEDLSVFNEKIIPLLKKGETWSGEILMKRGDNSFVLTEVHASAVFNEKGEIENFAVLFSDITKRKKAELALKEAYDFTKTIFSSIPAAVFSKDREGRYLLVNEEFAEYAGLTPEEMKGKTVKECWPSEASLIYHQKDLELMERDGVQIYEYYLPHKERGKVPGIFHKACFHDAEGKVAGLVGVFLDLSELKKTQAALKESEERSKAILDALPDILFTLDEEGKFLTYHSPSESLLFMPPEYFLGKRVEEVLPEKLWKITREAIDIVKKTGKTYLYEYSLTLNNEKKWFEARMVKKGKKEFLVMVRDITERRKLEAQLIQAQKMETVGTLAGGIAHDFNNILTVINGYCEIGMKKVEKNMNLRNEISAIYDATQKAIKLVSQLLAFSRRQLISPRVLNLNNVISELYSMLKRLISEDIHLELNFEERDLKIKMDPSQLEQILVNLVVNAKDAIEEKGDKTENKKITIETFRVFIDDNYVKKHPGSSEGEFAVISVSDTGIGMSKEVLEKVFEPFFTTKGVGKGTGLGLSTVYGIVKQNNGFVYIYSEEGEGTTVKVYFPVVQESEEDIKVKRHSVKEEVRGRGETILIVEDSDDVRGFLKEALKNLGYNVLESSNGSEALRIFRENSEKVELIITDLIMPEMNGKELSEKIKEIKPEIKILFTSGYTENHIAHRGILDKNINLLQKPYSLKELSEKISRIINSK